MGLCAGCGAQLPPSKGGPPRKWCSERCRKGQYAGTCERCGKPTSGYNGAASASSRCHDCMVAEQTKSERNERLVELWEAGIPAAEIGRRLGMTQHAVASWIDVARRLKGQPLSRRALSRGKKTERFEYIARRLHAGASPAEIADEIGTTTESVRNMIFRGRREGFDMPRPQKVGAR